jgi:UDP-glucuronate 4-epimerase
MANLLTGAAGFIGFHIARALLARGERVIGVDDLNPYYDPSLKRARVDALTQEFGERLTFHQVNFADAAALHDALGDRELNRIVHVGAQAGVRYGSENPGAYVQSNLVGHMNILELARGRAVPHLVYASSSSVYGGSGTVPFRVEDRADRPLSLYAATKRADELLSESYSSLYRIPTTGLRFFTVYGPWGRPDMAMWLFTKAILAGDPVRLFNRGQMRRDFTYVDDVVAGVIASLESPPIDDGAEKPGGSRAPHALYNIGNNHAEDLMRLIAVMEDALGRKARTEMLPAQPGEVIETCADISEIRRDFGFEPKTTIEEGVPRFVEWYKGYHGIG